MRSKIVIKLDLPVQRILTGLIAVAIFTAALFFNVWSFVAFIVAIALLSSYEYSKNILQNKLGLRPIFFAMVPVLLVVLSILYPGQFVGEDVGWPFAASGVFINCMLAYLLYSGSTHHLQEKIPTALSMLWIGIPWALSISLYMHSGPMLIFLILCMIWVSDSGAYFIGKKMGKKPLFPSISPKKTVEGAIGGLVSTIVFAACIPLFSDVLSLPYALITAVIIVVVGITGDLIESRMKRRAGIKDSGNLLPGHGGLLDRFDSFMTSICFVYLFFLSVNLISLS